MSTDPTGAKAVRRAWEESPLLTSVAMESPCPYCKAQPGEPCRTANGDRYVTLAGEPRHHAKRGGAR